MNWAVVVSQYRNVVDRKSEQELEFLITLVQPSSLIRHHLFFYFQTFREARDRYTFAPEIISFFAFISPFSCGSCKFRHAIFHITLLLSATLGPRVPCLINGLPEIVYRMRCLTPKKWDCSHVQVGLPIRIMPPSRRKSFQPLPMGWTSAGAIRRFSWQRG